MPNTVKIGLKVWAGPTPRYSGDRSGLHFFVFFALCPGHTAGPIATLRGSKCAVSAKEVPFGGLETKNNVWGSKPPKNENFWGI